MAASAIGVTMIGKPWQHGGSLLLLWHLICALIYSPTLIESTEAHQNVSYLMLANRDVLYRVNLDESNFTEVISNSSYSVNTVAIDYDIRRNFLFWSDVKFRRIILAELDGSNPRVLIDSEISVVDGLAWDWMGGNLYFTDSYQHEIEVYSFAKGQRTQLVDLEEGATPRALVVDPNTRYVYWTDWGDVPRIERISMDGTDRQTLHNTSLQWPNGITLDYQSQVLYWVDAGLDKIESSFTDGSHRRVLSTRFIFHPFSVAFFDGVLYWSDWHIHQVLYAPTASPADVVGLTPPLSKDPLGIKVISVDAQPINSTNPCGTNHGGCSHLCLLSATSNSSYTCACPQGLALQDDGMRCDLPLYGSCRAAGYRNCCDDGDCSVAARSRTCHCDTTCLRFGDCCSDFDSICDTTSRNLTIPTAVSPTEHPVRPSTTRSVIHSVLHSIAASEADFSLRLTSTATPAIATPSTATPAIATPSTATPAIDTPSTATPAIATPSTATPAMATPSTATPAMATPSTATPAMATPSTATPAMATPSTKVTSISEHLEMATTIHELVQSSGVLEESRSPTTLLPSSQDIKASVAVPQFSQGLQQNGGPTNSSTPVGNHEGRAVLLVVMGVVGVLLVLIMLVLSILLFLFILSRNKILRRGVISSSSFENNDPFDQLGSLSRKHSFKDSMDSGVDLDIKTDTRV